MKSKQRDRVFYSWQSDCPNNTNRSFIEKALKDAIKEIRKDDSIKVEPVIDRDTAGVPGSPDITETIFSKIEASSIFVCDVSIINKGKKTSPNPNVLIELGYAIRVLGWNRIIMIMNTEYGEPSVLPFDLRSKRVLTYSIKDNVTEKAPTREKLKKKLVEALELIFKNEGIRSDLIEKINVAPDYKKADSRLFAEFKEVLPSNGSIGFINEQNMAGFSWPKKKLDDLKDFYYKWNNAEYEFLDSELESLRRCLYELIGDYLEQIATNTFPANDLEYQTVPPEWETEYPKRFSKVVNELHKTAKLIVETHQELIRKARKKFGV